jgi:polyisoprenoid-binding protein YceI
MSEAETNPRRYVINAARSRLTAQAFAGGLLSAFGHNPIIAFAACTGEILFPPAELSQAQLQLVIQTGTLSVSGKLSEKDRQEIEQSVRETVLEVQRYPEISFVSTAVKARPTAEGQYHVQLTGDLTLHGVTRRQTLETIVTLADSQIRARGDANLQQSAFGIQQVKAVAGALKVKDTVKINFEMVAERALE